MRKTIKSILIISLPIFLSLAVSIPVFAATNNSCGGVDTALINCDDNSNGIWSVLSNVKDAMMVGVGILATIGIGISGIQWLTAGDDVAKATKAKRRLFEIVIGLAAFVLINILLNFLLPGFTEEESGNTYKPGEAEVLPWNSSNNSSSNSSSSDSSSSSSSPSSSSTSSSTTPDITKKELFWPLPKTAKGKTSSAFGYRTYPYVEYHHGEDIPGSAEDPIVSVSDGKVCGVGNTNARGYYILIFNEETSTKFVYQHMNRAALKSVGDYVKAGEKIGVVGSTGNSTGPHLHFEIHINDSCTNKIPWSENSIAPNTVDPKTYTYLDSPDVN